MTRILWYMALVQSETVDHATNAKFDFVVQNHFINTFFSITGSATSGTSYCLWLYTIAFLW